MVVMAAPTARWSPADVLTAVRIPLAAAFVLVPDMGWRVAILAAAALSDFADGFVARRWGSSRLGVFLDPVADKVFVVAAFAVVLASGALTPLEVLGVLARDLTAPVPDRHALHARGTGVSDLARVRAHARPRAGHR